MRNMQTRETFLTGQHAITHFRRERQRQGALCSIPQDQQKVGQGLQEGCAQLAPAGGPRMSRA